MATVFDVAAHILATGGPMTAMKLQKLVYYSQAWSLVWEEAPLFPERIEAWANGPVTPDLYFAHQGEFNITAEPRGDARALTEEQAETVRIIVQHYGQRTAPQLSALTHQEGPWVNARRGLAEGQRGNVEITHASMAEYYGNL